MKYMKKEYCKTCKRHVRNEVGILKEGIYQLGQGSNKPLLTFCNKRCMDKYRKEEVKDEKNM